MLVGYSGGWYSNRSQHNTPPGLARCYALVPKPFLTPGARTVFNWLANSDASILCSKCNQLANTLMARLQLVASLYDDKAMELIHILFFC